MKHEPEHEQYIGKPLSECPDGTVAVVSHLHCDREVRIVVDCMAHSLSLDGEAAEAFFDTDTYTVHHILKLGTPRPKTLADEEAGVVWYDGGGKAGMAFVRTRGDDVLLFDTDSGLPFGYGRYKAIDVPIRSNWTRLGPITGIEIGGEVWRGNNPE